MTQTTITRITRKMLVDWAGERVVEEAEQLHSRGLVLEAEFEPPYISGSVLWSNRPLRTRLRILDQGGVESECPCWANRERGLICVHVIAIAVSLVKRMTDPQREAKYRDERRRAERLANVDEDEYLQRVPPETPGAIPAGVRITLGRHWRDGFLAGRVPLRCDITGQGQAIPADAVPRALPLTFSERDKNLLFVIEDICEGPARGRMEVGQADFVNLLQLLRGRAMPREDGQPVTVNDAQIDTHLRMHLDADTGELRLTVHADAPLPGNGDEEPFYLVSGRRGWICGGANLWPLHEVLPEPYHPVYDGPVTVGRTDVIRFLRRELPALERHARVESQISLELFTIEPAAPAFRLTVSGSSASLSATLHADYGSVSLIACKPDAREHFAIPDPDDLMRYLVRNPHAERQALQMLARTGLRGEYGDALDHIVDNRNVLNFLSTYLPWLRRQGWRVELQGSVAPYMESLDFATPVVQIDEPAGQDWFEVAFDFEDRQGASVSQADIQTAIRKGEFFIKRSNRTVLIDSDAVTSALEVFSDCASSAGDRPGRFRLQNIYAPFVQSSLDRLDGVDVEDTPRWRERASCSNRTMEMRPVAIEPRLDAVLRPYQRTGVNWLRFLEENGFCGILADEMGLGKTVQTLAWLQTRHASEDTRRPTLIVCPTSLIDNWMEECARFVPRLKTLALSGADRHEKWDQVEQADVVVTSYALLRRDLDRYLQFRFSAAVLDEAQHIKNRSTQNAVSAKQLDAGHRLVLTGTPIENSVADLWSIMDFLMPGYLGSHEAFKAAYELPIGRGSPEDAAAAQAKLKRKLHPFMLRRLKRDVAQDLPPKIESTSFCTLTPDQRAVYNEVLAASQQRIRAAISKQGFQRSRMEILATLTRLRQACCHLNLLKLPGLEVDAPSAKMELLTELLDEAVDSGHRLLIFSQFVRMLRIIRDELDSRGLSYCYLDGSTQDRLQIVHRFNTERSIPAFLISLKAGGTGLNLTGADMVVHFDPWWNPAVENQATDRAYRIGQKRTVYSVKLIARNTVEEKVLALQQRKKAIIDATIERDQDIAQTLTWEDVQDLLEL